MQESGTASRTVGECVVAIPAGKVADNECVIAPADFVPLPPMLQDEELLQVRKLAEEHLGRSVVPHWASVPGLWNDGYGKLFEAGESLEFHESGLELFVLRERKGQPLSFVYLVKPR